MKGKSDVNFFRSVLLVAFGAGYLTYLFATADLIPDPTPIIGYVDDALVFFLVLWAGWKTGALSGTGVGKILGLNRRGK